MSKKAILLGATGLIGHNLLYKLLSDETYNEVLIISRKSSNITHVKLKEIILNFDEIANYSCLLYTSRCV